MEIRAWKSKSNWWAFQAASASCGKSTEGKMSLDIYGMERRPPNKSKPE